MNDARTSVEYNHPHAHNVLTTDKRVPKSMHTHTSASHNAEATQHLKFVNYTAQQFPASSTDLYTMISLMNRPHMEPDVFKGNLKEFPVWLKSFESIIEPTARAEGEKLFMLSKYTAGDARRAIEGFLLLDEPNVFQHAKSVLIKRFGDKYKLSEVFKGELANWPTIKPGDGTALQKLADFMQHCNIAMSSIQYLECLSSADENMKILKKLPRYVCDRWNRIVDHWLYGTQSARYPPFSEFCRFINEEARVTCGPGNRRHEKMQSYETEGGQRTVKAFAAVTDEYKSESKPTDDIATTAYSRTTLNCPVCSSDHVVNECKQFLHMNIQERRELARRKGLCFRCLHRGHLQQDCKQTGASLLYVKEAFTAKEEETESSSTEETSIYEANVYANKYCLDQYSSMQ